jgi:lipopolysaccharide export system protein LptC
MSAAGIELNLPDLPEVPISLGPTAVAREVLPRPQLPLGSRVREALTSYLPLLMMVLLALGTWWLVKNSPKPLVLRAPEVLRGDPDYTMNGFSVQRFARDGRLTVRIEGREMRHFPNTDRIEIDEATIRAFSPDGRMTKATARQAIANGDASEVQLLGGARVRSVTPAGEPVELDSEFLHAFVDTERIRTHLPVQVRVGTKEIRAAGMDFDNLSQRLDLQGPMRGTFPPGARRAPK